MRLCSGVKCAKKGSIEWGRKKERAVIFAFIYCLLISQQVQLGVLLSPSGIFLSSKFWVRKMLGGEEESRDKMCCVIYPFFTILALLLQLFLQARSSAWFSTIFLLLWMFLQFLAAFAADPLCWYVSAGAD